MITRTNAIRPLAFVAAGILAANLAQAQKVSLEGAPTTQPGSTPAALTLTVDQAVQIAISNSKQLRVAKEAVDKARGVIHENRAGFMPSVSSSAGYTHLGQGTTAKLPSAGGQPITFPILVQDQKTAGLSVTLPIDISGQIRAAVQQSEFRELSFRLDYNRTRNEVVLNVKNAYYDVLRAKALTVVQEQALKSAQDREATTEAALRAGTGTRFDVLRAQTEVANVRQNLITAQNQVDLTTATLNNALGLDQNTPLEIVEPSETADSGTEFDDAVAEAYKVRPEVLQADMQIKAAEKGVALAHRNALPSFGVTGSYTYTPDAGGFAPLQNSWQIAGTLSVPLFDQGVSKARLQQARADVNTAKASKQITLDTIALEVRQAHLSVVEARNRLDVTSAALTQAREQYRLAQVRFKAGVSQAPGTSPLLEISDAQTALTQTENNQLSAQYDLKSAYARLERAIGRSAYGPDATWGLKAPGSGLPKK